MSRDKQKDHLCDAVINVGSVGKAFGDRLVLDDVNLAVTKAQSVCLCGINGAGKSTLLRIITGLLQPDKGSIRLSGYCFDKDPDKARLQLGVISHKSMVYPDLTVLENLSFFANLYNTKSGSIRVNKLIEDVGLSSYRYDKAAVLSRGLLQRLAIARALIHEPKVLLADEPFTGLDVEACRHLVEVLNTFSGNGGTVLMTTHDINFALRCCGRVVVLDKAKLIFDALTDEIDIGSFTQDYLSYARNSK